MKRILVIEREYGAGGSSIAEKAAQRLGWKLLDQGLTEEIARRAKVRPSECAEREERMDPFLYRLLKVFWRGSHERSVEFVDAGELDAECLMKITEKVLKEAAEAGNCVIVGRAAPYYLRNRDDTFCVFLFAPRDFKFHRVMEEVHDEAKAVDLVDKVDQERAEFIQHYFGVQWPSRHLYDAMLNTAIGDDATVDLILYLVSEANKRAVAAKK